MAGGLDPGDLLDSHDPEPPVGTVIQTLHDEEVWERVSEEEWGWAGHHDPARRPVWRWRRVTFDGPVYVIKVPDN